MDVILFNLSWMTFNISLGVISVVAGFSLLKVKPKGLQLLLGIFWLLFLPNTIYMLTDSIHLFEDLPTIQPVFQVLDILQYLLLMGTAIITFLLAMYPLEKQLRKIKQLKKKAYLIIFIFNFIVSFAVVLGRVERANSWDVVLNPLLLMQQSIHIFTSSRELLFLIGFGILTNSIYFGYKLLYKNYLKK